MPIFTYICPSCKESYQDLVTTSEDKSFCPECKVEANRTCEGLGSKIHVPLTP